MMLIRFFLLFLLLFPTAFVVKAQEKPKVFVFTDIGGDPDDEQSLVRFLYYSDMFDIKGLAVTSRLKHGQDVRPDIIYKHLDAYAEILPNLLKHSSGFPKPEELRKIVKRGIGNHAVLGSGYDSEASDYLIEVIDNSDTTIHVLVWGGLREVAQTLWKINQTRDESEIERFVQKIQVHVIGNQDGHRDWIIENFEDLKLIANGFAWFGSIGIRELSVFRGMYMTGDHSLQNSKWIEEYVYGNGPLSQLYPIKGGGVNGMKEGDTPSFLGLIRNGLNSPENPEWGGWGGRFRLVRHNLYVDAPDFLDGVLNERHAVSRWRPAFQHDFMARLGWAWMSYEEANHNPVVVVNDSEGPAEFKLEASAGDEIILNATKTYDPDGDDLSFHWFVYEEILKPDFPLLPMQEKIDSVIQFQCPNLPSGKQYHIILEVTDGGTPSLTSYKRIILDIK